MCKEGVSEHMDNLIVLLFCYLLQSILMVYVGLALFDIPLEKKRLILCGAFLGVGVWLIRGVYSLLGATLGSHSLILLLLVLLVLKTVGNQKWPIALGATLVSMILLVLGSAFIQVLIKVFSLEISQILNNTWSHILWGFLESVFLVLFFFLNKLFGLTIVGFLDAD